MKNTFKYGLITVGILITIAIGCLLLVEGVILFFWLLGMMFKYPLISFLIIGIPTAYSVGHIIGSEKNKV